MTDQEKIIANKLVEGLTSELENTDYPIIFSIEKGLASALNRGPFYFVIKHKKTKAEFRWAKEVMQFLSSLTDLDYYFQFNYEENKVEMIIY